MFPKDKINSFAVIASIIVITIMTITGIVLSRQYVLRQAETRIQDVLQEAEALHHYVQEEMHPAMYQLKQQGRMPENFYSPEILSSSLIARRVFRHYNSIRILNNQPLVEYKLASKNPRNKINLSDSLEASLIDMFNTDSTLKKYSGIINNNKNKYLYYAKPFLRIENKCLKCHGNSVDAPNELRNYYKWESGFNLKLGSIPAIEIIKTPLVAELKTSSKIGFAISLTAVLMITLIILYSRLTYTNKYIYAQKNKIENTYNKLKETQAQLVQSEKMASLGILTAGVAHEINNPLNFINGAYMGLESFFKSKAPEYKDDVSILLKGLKKGIDRSSGIIQSLNQFSRNNIEYSEDCHIHSIIDNCLSILCNKCKENIHIDKKYTQKDIIIKGNVGKLHQAFLNILTNAIQAINNSGNITIITQRKSKNITVRIIDTGCGVKQENITKVFTPFYTTKDPGKGTGLGLSITYNIIQDHKGSIELKSEPNEGTSITITLPIT